MRKVVVAALALVVVFAAGVAYAVNTYNLTKASTFPTGVGKPSKPIPKGVSFDYTVKDSNGPAARRSRSTGLPSGPHYEVCGQLQELRLRRHRRRRPLRRSAALQVRGSRLGPDRDPGDGRRSGERPEPSSSTAT